MAICRYELDLSSDCRLPFLLVKYLKSYAGKSFTVLKIIFCQSTRVQPVKNIISSVKNLLNVGL